MREDFWDFVRHNVVGVNGVIETPFGRRPMLYADHTASGRAVRFIEDYLQSLFAFYGNTHTDDDFTGNLSTTLLEEAMGSIKRLLHAGEHHKLILVGTGATGAIERLQQILGLYLPPATRARFQAIIEAYPEGNPAGSLERTFFERRPVVFVGPYEHHSNEVTWRECFAEVVEIGLTEDGLIDLEELKEQLGQGQYSGRQKIGSFSAASNVSGVRSDVYEIARVLHRGGAIACFDFAASAPYLPIDVDHDEESYFDALFFSPHKFLGGPGSTGILLIHDAIYRADLPPTHGGGGTVDFVSRSEQHYLASIEGREMAGTPGIVQVWKAALALELKEELCPEAIEERERELTLRAYERVGKNPKIEIIGTASPENRIGILSFLVRDRSSYLHPRFVARLLNDLFGIQSRGGCSCAGPYGHRVLAIGEDRSARYRSLILEGKCGIKPGWTRVTLHYLLTDEELDYICDALDFVSEEGRFFLPLYTFDSFSGSWKYSGWESPLPSFGLGPALDHDGAATAAVAEDETRRLRVEAMREAKGLAAKLHERYSECDITTLAESPFPFEYYDRAHAHRAGER